MSKHRVLYLDVIRVLACLMVITMHAPKPDLGTNPLILSSISFLMAPCIGLFFMVSGALLLPVSLSMREFYRKRLGKIVVPTLVWTIFYLVLRWINESLAPSDMLHSVLSIPFSAQGHGVLWFMYTLTGLYLLAPILSPWLEKASQKEIEFILSLWGITLCYPLIKSWVSVDDSMTGILYSFSGYAGYFLLGYYLHNYRQKVTILTLVSFIIIPISIAVYCKIRSVDVDFYSAFWYLSILVVMMAVSIFIIVKRICERIEMKGYNFLALASSLSFGIYLSHIFFMREVIWRLPFINQFGGLIQILLTVCMTYILAFVFSLFISSLKWGYYVTGYKCKGR